MGRGIFNGGKGKCPLVYFVIGVGGKCPGVGAMSWNRAYYLHAQFINFHLHEISNSFIGNEKKMSPAKYYTQHDMLSSK